MLYVSEEHEGGGEINFVNGSAKWVSLLFLFFPKVPLLFPFPFLPVECSSSLSPSLLLTTPVSSQNQSNPDR